MNFATAAFEYAGGTLRDLVARGYPWYSRCKDALFVSRADIQSAVREGLKFREQAESWSVDRKLDWILRRLRGTVRRAYLTTAYYREKYDRLGFDPFLDFGF